MMQKVKNFLGEIGGLFKSNTAHMVTVVIVSFLLGALLFGGSGGNSAEEPSKEQQNAVTEQQNQTEEPEVQNDIDQNDNNGVLGEYDVTIVSHRVIKNYDDSPVILVKYAFTNNSDEAASFDWTIKNHLFQNGVELTEAIVVYDDYNSELSYSEIKPGVTLELEKAYSMRDTSAQITVELSKLISFSDDVVTYTIDLQ